MGALDDMKDKAQDLATERGDEAKEGLEKAGDFADEKTGGKHSDKIDQGVEKGGDFIDKAGEKENPAG
ncbi:MAG: antitoxin [Actinomycetota bacterium]|nr:antitoxin [Actinomycetota bacterium]